MTRQDTAKLLSLIKLSYPAAYRHIDKATASATISMWQMTFHNLPYPIMEQAYNRYRMTHKYPPTVAEIVEELRHIYYDAAECAMVLKHLGNQDMSNQYKLIMEHTKRYADIEISNQYVRNIVDHTRNLPIIESVGYLENYITESSDID